MPVVLFPRAGHYEGLDAYRRPVSFTYSAADRLLLDITVSGRPFGSASVSGGSWHYACLSFYCTSGRWRQDSYVTGLWFTRDGGEVTFEATLVTPEEG